jgi:hypothetical protein
MLHGQGFEFSLARIAIVANLEQQLRSSSGWIDRAALLGWRRASFCTPVEHCKLFVESRNRLSDAGFCEDLFPDWMLTLQPLESRLQIPRFCPDPLVFGFPGDHGFIFAFDSTRLRVFQFQP